MTVSSKPLLTIVIPFFNAASKSDRLVARLSGTLPSDVEVICVDDGSTDDTPRVLERLQHTIGSSCRVIRQTNRGPGGARNTGLFAARGEFVWFVDADDDIRFDGVPHLRSIADPSSVEFIDFNILENGLPTDTMGFVDGRYVVGTGATNDAVSSARLIGRFGRVWSKAFRRAFLIDERIYFPELCIFEDNAFALVAATRTRAFAKSSAVVYEYRTEHDSVTRGGAGGLRSPRFYDRLLTSRYALSEAGFSDAEPNARAALTDRFIELFLFNSTSLKPSNADLWWASIRVVREFRSTLEELGIHASQVRWANAGSIKGAILRFVFLASRLLPSQRDYFRRLRHDAWGQYELEIPVGPAAPLPSARSTGDDGNTKKWPPIAQPSR